MKSRDIAIVGAGFTGAVIARELAMAGHRTEVIEFRDHVAGNCHTTRCPVTGVLVHKYGPHIFHTSDPVVWQYVQAFAEFMPFTNRVKAVSNGQVFSLPINLHTINQFFGMTLNPSEARDFIASMAVDFGREPLNFEEQALAFIGRDLYEALFRGYTEKQWGTPPQNLPASILKRLPIRFNYDDNYYSSRFQGMPRCGYTDLVEKILEHPNVSIRLGSRFLSKDAKSFSHVFYSGPIDEWYGHCFGPLTYRTLRFEEEIHPGDYQGNAVLNYCDRDVPWTRISEHKHFSPWEEHLQTIVSKEFSSACTLNDTPYYPVRALDDKDRLTRYQNLAAREVGVTFVGRLGTYRYLDMHVAIGEALVAAKTYLQCLETGEQMPGLINNY